MDLAEDPEIHMEAETYGSGDMALAEEPEIQRS